MSRANRKIRPNQVWGYGVLRDIRASPNGLQ
jgi:hypothetical protein